MLTTTLLIVLVSLSSLSFVSCASVTSKICASKILKLAGLYCNDCVEFWPQNPASTGADDTSDSDDIEALLSSKATTQELIKKLLAKINKMDRGATPPQRIDQSENLEDLVVGCCMHTQCRLSDIMRFCCV